MSKEKIAEEKYKAAASAGPKIGMVIKLIYEAASMVTYEDLAAMDEYNSAQEAIIPILDPKIARAAYGLKAFERVRDRVELIKRIKSYKEAGI